MYFNIVALLPLLAVASAGPARIRRQAGCPSLELQDYADFQISDGIAGNAAADAAAIFVDPFNGCDLATVDQTTIDNLEAMRNLAEDAELEQFNPAIEAAGSDAEAQELQAGKDANKVLKHTIFLQFLQIEAAQGADNADDITAREAKLAKNAAIDAANAGQTMRGVA